MLDDDAETPAKRPTPPPPAAKPTTEADPVPVIELEVETGAATEADAALPDMDEDEAGGDTVRMPLSDVVQAWAEEGESLDAPAAAGADPAERPSAAGLPLGPILVLAGAVLLIVLLIVLV